VLPDTSGYLPANHDKQPDFVAATPARQALPVQEDGQRPARALPYDLRVGASADVEKRTLRINFDNRGNAGACFQVRSANPDEGPWTFTVEAGKQLSNTWQRAGNYDLSVFGPNGFFQQFRGSFGRESGVDLDVDVRYDVHAYALIVLITNRSRSLARLQLVNAYGDEVIKDELSRGRALKRNFSLKNTFGWYDIAVTSAADSHFLWRFAGHLENGRDSASDPAIGSKHS
jgi:phospholipase C